jgi:hypothetical protein
MQLENGGSDMTRTSHGDGGADGEEVNPEEEGIWEPPPQQQQQSSLCSLEEDKQ